MKNFLLEQQQKSERIGILTEFIHSHPEARELKRAIAVKMVLQGEPYSQITKLVGMNKSCITNWKQRFEAEGIDGIKLGYKGAKSYLTTEQHTEIITWLREKEYCNIDELVNYLDENYGVIYQSKQSYYDLLSSAKISWNKSQKINPNFNPDLVKIKREEIINFLTQNQAEIESGHLVVFFVDECHLLANDVCGYVLGKTDIRIEILIKNIKDKQTYFGALDYKTQEFIVHEYPTGNSSSTVNFIKYLQNQRPGKRIALIWDGASYHRSDEVKKFLSSVNDHHQPDQWQITCIRFAPNAPEQNPVEDVWLQTKNFLRKYWHLCKSFSVVKWLFKFFTNHQEFDFPKLHQYEPCSDLK
ncbi:IS630 family transposase [Nostoc sp.]|uniref:IS630 family transposase n=1 Tax=Nostoc sp. TaxID=1180 RepID=UPI001D9D2B63|nr:IS630 family transposase [Nostoc sp. JL34]